MAGLPSVMLTSTAHSLDTVCDPVQGAGYDGNADGLQTLAVTMSRFRGRLEIQGTLDTTHSGDWTSIDLVDDGLGYIDYTDSTTGTFMFNIVGNWVWLRARVTKTHDDSLTLDNSGVVSLIQYNY